MNSALLGPTSIYLSIYAIMAIIAHFIDSKGARQAKLIALRYLDGEHTGENMAALLLKVFREYTKDRKSYRFLHFRQRLCE
jgi:hypothetical protein